MIHVAIIDDHPAILEWFIGAVTRADGLVLVCAEPSIEAFDRAAAAVRRADGPGPDVVLLDLSLAGAQLDGAAGVVHVVGQGFAVLVLSASGNREAVLGALEAGARGYMLKTTSTSDIFTAIREVAAGHHYVTPTLAAYLLRASADSAVPVLTPREEQVLVHVATGMTDKEIAARLGIGVSTVRSHLDNMGAKLGERRRAALASHAHRLGLTRRRP
jgi:DNA-binding NarL/FixJ family response regulator